MVFKPALRGSSAYWLIAAVIVLVSLGSTKLAHAGGKVDWSEYIDTSAPQRPATSSATASTSVAEETKAPTKASKKHSAKKAPAKSKAKAKARKRTARRH